MSKLFSHDSPIIQLLERVADFFILNILTVVCSIPLFTMGAALTAHHKVMQGFALDEEQRISRAYFSAFVSNFKQSTVLWLFTVLVIAFLCVDLLVVYIYFDVFLAHIMYVLLGIVGFVALGTAAYTFPLIARYDNTLKEHLRNGLFLAVGKLPRTALMLLVYAIPVLLAVASLTVFFNTLIVWFTFGISIIIYIQARLMKPVILMLERNNTDDEEQDTRTTGCVPYEDV